MILISVSGIFKSLTTRLGVVAEVILDVNELIIDEPDRQNRDTTINTPLATTSSYGRQVVSEQAEPFHDLPWIV